MMQQSNQDVKNTSKKTNESIPSDPRRDGELLNSSFQEQQPTFKRAAMAQRPNADLLHVSDMKIDSIKHLTKPRSKPKLVKSSNFVSEPSTFNTSVKGSYTSWDVVKGQALPPYPIGRTHTIDKAPSEVSKNIVEGLRRLSVHAIYDPAKAEAMCTTSCGCKFKVTLFAAKEADKTVMEIMRRRGCGLAYSNVQRAVLRSAQGIYEEEKMPSLSIPKCIAAKYEAPSMDYLRKILEDSSKELQTNDQSVQLTTLRLVASMTDATKSHAQSSIDLSKMIMQGESDIREICLNLLRSEATDDFSNRIKCDVLAIFSNCLRLLSKDQIQKTVNGEDPWCRDILFPIIVKAIKDCACPHGCTLLSQCLCVLLKHVPNRPKKGGDLEAVLKKAVKRGEESHMDLKKNALFAIAALQN